MVINGKKIAGEIIASLQEKKLPQKFLAAFLVGDNPASLSFLRRKEETAKELGVDFQLHRYPTEANHDDVRREIKNIISDDACGGAIAQLPLPTHLNTQFVLNAIPHEKDVDVLGEHALGAFYAGRDSVLPPAVGAMRKIIEHSPLCGDRYLDDTLLALRVAVVGRGPLVGKPIALWLMSRVAELAVFTSGTEKLDKKLMTYDVIISGVGKAGLIKPEHLKKDALVIDFGYDEVGGKMHGDFAVPASSWGGSYTPTPGGTGPILVAQLFENFYTLNRAS
jgi:methylenetetrahydrofolate dehydrogenase (NADP+) / methenyltetrahydrofolate cyclohydrolase